MAFYAEGIQSGDVFFVRSSSRPGPNMLGASSNTGNYSIGQPMACQVTVSDPIITAANCEISGRVINKSRRGINGARLTLLDTQNNRTTSIISNPFGNFQFTGLSAGSFYVLSVTSKRYTFAQSIRTFQLLEDVTDLRIVAD